MKTYLSHYRLTLETFFPQFTSSIPFYSQFPFKAFVLRMGTAGAIIGYRPAPHESIEVMNPTDLDPPQQTLNVCDLAEQWQAVRIDFDTTGKAAYEVEAARSKSIGCALNDALDLFWNTIPAELFLKFSEQILALEGVAFDSPAGIASDEHPRLGTVEIPEPGGFRRQEVWRFMFNHHISQRVSATLIHDLEQSIESGTGPPDCICVLTSGDLTSIGKHVLVRSHRVRVWDRFVLNRLVNLHIEAIAPHFTEYAKAAQHLFSASPDEALRNSALINGFKRQLTECPPGQNHFPVYEQLGTSVLDFVFTPALSRPKRQQRTHDGTQRKDLVLRNEQLGRFWKRVYDRFGADFIVVDFKNHAEPISATDIWDVAKYSGELIGRFILVVSRKGANSSVRPVQMRLLHQSPPLMIIVISDIQLLEMCARKMRGEEPADLLEDLYDELALTA